MILWIMEKMTLQPSSFKLPENFKGFYPNFPEDLPEAKIQSQVCKYLRDKYPEIRFCSDSSGIKLDAQAAAKLARSKSGRGIPDLIILEPRLGYNGLLIEIKKDNVTLKNKKGEYIGAHFKEQGLMLSELSDKGYLALFGVGLIHCLAIIDTYLK